MPSFTPKSFLQGANKVLGFDVVSRMFGHHGKGQIPCSAVLGWVEKDWWLLILEFLQKALQGIGMAERGGGEQEPKIARCSRRLCRGWARYGGSSNVCAEIPKISHANKSIVCYPDGAVQIQ